MIGDFMTDAASEALVERELRPKRRQIIVDQISPEHV
jgi:hypothetical protein